MGLKIGRSAARTTSISMALAGAALLASCGPKKELPPPPPVATVPPRPYPPMGASPTLVIPPAGPTGMRVTVNTGIGTEQTTWTLRSAYNVAALNCRDAEHAAILGGYSQFLKTHAKSLKAANAALDTKFKAQYGKAYIAPRETYQTQIYNYFALPPVLPAFCDAATRMSADLQAVPAGRLDAFAPGELAKLDAVFLEFFNSYDQYRADLALWEARYGTGLPIAAKPIAVIPDGALLQ
ncbi:MAG TPA: hypothetical protein VJM34_16785 [Novosphingobium sp.]|nr:hypothetical protein [Novosphingobium sp.]